MSIKKIIQIGDERLREQNKAVVEFGESLGEFITDLTDTMRDAGLIGLAAPQIGINKRVFVTEVRKTEHREADQTDELRVYINPKILTLSDEKVKIYEGCGSCIHGKIVGPVTRPMGIKIKAQNQEGEWFEMEADGILARVIQHEIDHIKGKIYLEKIVNNKELIEVSHYISDIKNAAWHKENSRINVKKINYEG
jgi:peptide deformylase